MNQICVYTTCKAVVFLPFSKDDLAGMDVTGAELFAGNEVGGDAFFGFWVLVLVVAEFVMTAEVWDEIEIVGEKEVPGARGEDILGRAGDRLIGDGTLTGGMEEETNEELEETGPVIQKNI